MSFYTEKQITDTLRENYMPYAMSVIISRAIPEIDGFKPSHRKLLYTMYDMGLINGEKKKSASVVGRTMFLNPHGDAAIYETLVRLSRGHEALLYPFIESKGNFGKHYSRDMAYAASRYTECKLEKFCAELFADIDKDTVDFVDNYDGTLKEPTLLPTTFPNVLVNANTGIAVGMASSICSFNLTEICQTTAALIKNPDHDILSTLKAPDFSTGGNIVLSPSQMRDIYDTGRGSFKIRSKYTYDKKKNAIEITEIPYSTTIEAIMDKLAELIKAGKLKEIRDAKDLTDKQGLKLSIELKGGTDPEKLMSKLFKSTPLEDSFPCNFNILIAGMPRVMGVKEILTEWIGFRTECMKRGYYYDMTKKKDRLHLLKGLGKILLDIDRAIAIIRNTDEDKDVVPNLMIEFGIDKIQADFIADIKLRNLNKEYIINKLNEIEGLKAEIADIEDILANKSRFMDIMVDQLLKVAEKYGKPRKSDIIYDEDIEVYIEEEHIEDYPVNIFVTKEGYLKKITPLSLRMGGEQKFKEGDEMSQSFETSNVAELLVFTDKCTAYKTRVCEFADTKASVMGEYLPAKLKMEPDEKVIFVAVTTAYTEKLVIFYKEGKVNKTDLTSFATKTNRKRLLKAYSEKLTPVAFFLVTDEVDFMLTASNGKGLIINSALIPFKALRSAQGNNAIKLPKKGTLDKVEIYVSGTLEKEYSYRAKDLPATPKVISEYLPQQISLI